MRLIFSGGCASAIYSDEIDRGDIDLAVIGDVTIARASHVEPAPGGWAADMAPVGGPCLGPFASRGEALKAEVAWLNDHTDTWTRNHHE